MELLSEIFPCVNFPAHRLLLYRPDPGWGLHPHLAVCRVCAWIAFEARLHPLVISFTPGRGLVRAAPVIL